MLELVFMIVLSIIIVLLVIGLVRVLMTPSNGFGDFLMHLFCLDLITDLIVIIFELIGALLEGLGD